MVLLGGVYNVLLVGIGRVVFPAQAEGSLIRRADGTVVGSRLIAQKFTRPEYFHPRPSGVDYNAASTGGSNYGPSNPDHLKAVQERLDAIDGAGEGVTAAQVPSEMVTASGAGMDPHIPPAAAELQARARGLGARRVHRPRARARSGAHGAADVRVSRPGTRQRARAESGARRDARRAGADRPATSTSGHDHGRTRTYDLDLGSGDRPAGDRRFVRRSWIPGVQIKNPVMFIVEVGSLLTTIVFVQELASGTGQPAVHRTGRLLALVHGALRQLRGGDGRGPRQGAGGDAAQGQDRDDGGSPAAGGQRETVNASACARATSSASRPAR